MTFALPTSRDRVSLLVDWTRENRPADLPAAEKAQQDMHGELPAAVHKADRFLRFMDRRAEDLPPELRPWFWDGVTQALLLQGGDKCRWAAPRAHARARRAEADHGLPVDPDHHASHTLFVARSGVLPAKEVRAFQTWITQTLPPERAYPALTGLITARAAGGSAPAAGTHTLLAKTAKAAGVGEQEQSRALAGVLAASRGTAVPSALFTGAAGVFARTPPPAGHLAAFWELFPPGRYAKNDGGTWLRMLDASGAVDALVRGEVTPEAGVAGWLQRFVRLHLFVASGDGVIVQRMPQELYALLPRLAPRLRAEGRPLDTWTSGSGHGNLDGMLLAACLAHGIPVLIPPRTMEFSYIKDSPHLGCLLAHPVLGPRAELQISRLHRHYTGAPPGVRSAIGFYPGVPEAVPVVRARAEGCVSRVGRAGLPEARFALGELDDLLDGAAVAALEGIEDELAAVDPLRPLLRALHGGLPEELGWPAFDEAVAELGGPGGVRRLCPSWPVLTLVGADRAIAVDHTGRRDSIGFSAGRGETPVVRYLDGRFLVAVSGRAYWSDRPGDTFVPAPSADPDIVNWSEQQSLRDEGERSGYRFAPSPSQHSVMRQMSDGTAVWVHHDYFERYTWHVLTGAGVEQRTSLPGFFSGGPGEGMRWDSEHLSLVRLPEGVDSPLGHKDGLSGLRAAVEDHHGGTGEHVLEGADGRRARHLVRGATGGPMGILRFPGTGVDLVVTWGPRHSDLNEAFALAVEDDTLQWEVRTSPGSGRGGLPFYPPVGFWHFLRPRDPGSSAALRGVEPDTARALVDAHPAEGAAGVLKALDEHLPGVVREEVREGVVRVVAATAELGVRREKLVERVRADRAALTGAPAAGGAGA
ncbi:hypothetical protein [Nocardiopsis sp. NPDC057823]|uniref:hypothetical protein n=1 Tax=Nocardiopsis sp. NPDC057823 TaxID=3346256 RepID=UPI0036717954